MDTCVRKTGTRNSYTTNHLRDREENNTTDYDILNPLSLKSLASQGELENSGKIAFSDYSQRV